MESGTGDSIAEHRLVDADKVASGATFGGILGVLPDGLVIAVVRWQLRRSLPSLKRSLWGAGQPMSQV